MSWTLPEATRIVASLYRPLACGHWEMRLGGVVLTRGYWSPPQFVEMIALTRGGETWMSLTPLEFESQQIGIEAAAGHVVIMGLGMGWAAAVCALKPDVAAVTVVERDDDVREMHEELGLFSRLPDVAGEKVRILAGDALEWRADAAVNLLMPDIWLPLVSDGRIDEVRRMQANVGADAVYFWGQELEIARALRARGAAFNEAGIEAAAAGFGLPLVGPGTADHPARVEAAAAAWLREPVIGEEFEAMT